MPHSNGNKPLMPVECMLTVLNGMFAQAAGKLPLMRVDDRSSVCKLVMLPHADGSDPAMLVHEISRLVSFDMPIQDGISSPLRL